MGAHRRGLGMATNPAKNVAPAPAIIENYFVEQLHYFQQNRGEIHDIPRYTTYVKNLNQPDVPLFAELKGINCISRIVVDMWHGGIMDAWFELRDSKNGGNNALKFKISMKYRDVKINSYNQLDEFVGQYDSLIWLFKWHLNIVHMSREYLKGGWLERKGRIKAIEKAKEARKYLNKFGTTNIINNAKPEPLEGSGYQEKVLNKKSAINTMLDWKYNPSEIEDRVDHREFTEKEKAVISEIATDFSKETY